MNLLPNMPAALLGAVLGCLTASAPAQTPDGYAGVVTRSDTHGTGQKFEFSNLDERRPFVKFPGGNVSEMTKAFESTDLIVLMLVAKATGSTETFYLDKQQKRFTLIEVGALEAVLTGSEIRPRVTHGTLR
jgi:hypothetical protein